MRLWTAAPPFEKGRLGGILLINVEVIAKVRNLPFDKLRVNGLRLKSFTFSVRGELVEPQKNTFAIGSVVIIMRPLISEFKKNWGRAR